MEVQIRDEAWLSEGDQSWYREQVGEINGHKVRFKIRRNAYDAQSYARAEVWSQDRLEWSVVHSLDSARMHSCANREGSYNVAEICYVQKTLSPAGQHLMAMDLDELEEVATAILS